MAGVALHPNEAPKLAEQGALDDALWPRSSGSPRPRPRVRAVGETGLDYYRTGPEGVAAQKESFAAHIAMAHRHDKALVIHDRDAHDDVLEMLDAHGVPERTVLHCFSGDADFARACLDRGAYLSFAGTVTFKNAVALRHALQIAPIDRILVETDAPFLTPMPYRGRPNASYLVPLTVRLDGRDARRRPGDAVPGDRGQHRGCFRRHLVMAAQVAARASIRSSLARRVTERSFFVTHVTAVAEGSTSSR